MYKEESSKVVGDSPAPTEKKYRVKYQIDLRNRDDTDKILVENLLIKANNKEIGEEVTATDLFIFSLSKIQETDFKKIHDNSLTDWDRINIEHKKSNKKHKESLSLQEYLVKRLKLN
jgi:hypothetical protein